MDTCRVPSNWGPVSGGGIADSSDSARQRLLVAARELLAEQPVGDITVRMIAQRAGVGHALISRYYGSRGRLLTIAVGLALVELAAEVADAADARAAIRRIFDRVLSGELAAAINVIALQNEEVEEREGFPIVEALTAHLEAAGAPAGAARSAAATVTMMIFAWAGTETRWLRMGGYEDATTGRYEFLQVLFSLADRATGREDDAGPSGSP